MQRLGECIDVLAVVIRKCALLGAITICLCFSATAPDNAVAQNNSPSNSGFFDKGFVNQGIFPGLSNSSSSTATTHPAATMNPTPSAITPNAGAIKGANFDVRKYEDSASSSSSMPQEEPRAREDAESAYRNAADVIQRLRVMQENGTLPPPATSGSQPGFVRGRANPADTAIEKPGSFDHGSIDALRQSIRQEQDTSSVPTAGSSRVEKTVFDKADGGGGSASLSLIVAGQPEADLLRYIRAATSLKKTHNVKLDSIIVVGEIAEGAFRVTAPSQQSKGISIGDYDDSFALQKAGVQLSPISRALYDAEMLQTAFETVDDDTTRLGIEQVPSWVVKSGGEEHVFPGNYEPTSLFNGRGEFVGQQVGEARYAETKQSFLTTIVPHEPQGGKPLPRRAGAKVYALVIRPAAPRDLSSKSNSANGLGTKADTVEIPKLASCSVSRVRRQPIHQLPPFFPDNLVFYVQQDGRAPMPDAAEQQKLTLIPYREGKYDRGRWNEKEELQLWAPVLGVNCLPTRFVFAVEKGQAFMEWREGDSAWNLGG